MGVLLDTIGSLVIGSAFLLVMLKALFTLTSSAHNINMEYSLQHFSEEVITIIDSLYLEKAGTGVPASSDIVLNATSRNFRFRGKMNGDLSPIDTVEIIQTMANQDTVDRYGYPLRIYRNGTLEAGPFWLADTLEITYFDQNNDTTFSAGSVFSLSMEFTLTYDHYSTEHGHYNQIHIPILSLIHI